MAVVAKAIQSVESQVCFRHDTDRSGMFSESRSVNKDLSDVSILISIIFFCYFFPFRPRFLRKGLTCKRRGGLTSEGGKGETLSDDPVHGKRKAASIAKAVAVVVAEDLLIEVAE